LIGGAGNDQLYGGYGNDVYNGGAGNDLAQDWGGSDTYVFGVGSGQDIVQDWGWDVTEIDTVQVMSGVTTTNLFITQDWVTNPGGLTLRLAQSDDQLVIQNFNSIEQIQFADGTLWDASAIQARLQQSQIGSDGTDYLWGSAESNYLQGLGGNDSLYGNEGDDVLLGGAGDDSLDGGQGNDVLEGGAGTDWLSDYQGGSDTYRWGVGSGQDTVGDFDAGQGGLDAVEVQGATPAEVTITRDLGVNASALTLHIAGTMDTLTLQNWFDPNGQIEQIRFADGTVWDAPAVLARLESQLTGTEGNDSLFGSELGDTISGLGGPDFLYGQAGNDTLDGGAGADVMDGGAGDDTFIVDDAGDLVVEFAGGGNDTVEASVNFVLSNDAEVETVVLTGSSLINATGSFTDNKLIGNSGDNLLDGSLGNDTMQGGAGNDTYLVESLGDGVTENLNEGIDTVQSSVAYVLGDNVENLTLTGSAAINGTGNVLDNVLAGNSAGNVLTGGAGNDTYIVGAGDTVVENVNEGTDTVQSGVSFTLGANVESLALTGAASINGTGNALDNGLAGNSGDNILDGGAGADTMAGGEGNDTYVVDNVSDVVVENVGEGIDTVQSSVTYALGSNVENLTLTGSAWINGTGNWLDNVLVGNSGVNRLTGGAGNDTYVVGAGDSVVENANEGIDTVQSSVSFTLGANVENLTLTGTAVSSATGNSLANVLTGNSADNLIDGGAGGDTMTGGQGNDVYIVESTGDLVVENANEGADSVQSSITYTLGANVENLALTGTAAINGTGNALDNVLIGNSGANVLTGVAGNDTYVIGAGDTVVEAAGGGIDTVQSALTYTLGANVENLTLTGNAAINGTGNALNNILVGNESANTMAGGAGNDIYVVGVGDTVVESNNNGIDTVQSSVSWTLGANLENLTLLGTAAINGSGNGSANVMIGNSAANVLSAAAGADTLRGGAGNDTVNGGSGNDTYLFGRGDGQDLLQDSGGSADKVLYDAGINPLDLVISRQANDLRLAIHGSTDYVTIQNWYTSTSNQTETIQAGDGQTLLNSQVDQLIQAMATFSQQTGLTWDQAIDQRPQDVQTVLAASWQ
ncbi:MAG: calcium-binding protein, partial [Nitrospira sp.]|nr:calcium-binding protein [Nitrospira sp.]